MPSPTPPKCTAGTLADRASSPWPSTMPEMKIIEKALARPARKRTRLSTKTEEESPIAASSSVVAASEKSPILRSCPCAQP
ncbi:hypothetical protein FQZ97_1082370 [compost metagenome]